MENAFVTKVDEPAIGSERLGAANPPVIMRPHAVESSEMVIAPRFLTTEGAYLDPLV